MNKERRQNLSYLLLISMTVLFTGFFYLSTHGPWIYFREAEDNYHAQNYAKAIPFYIRADFSSNVALLHLAESYMNVGNFKDAVPVYQRYLLLNPKDKRNRLELARALEWSGNMQEAEIEFKKIVEEDL